MNRSGKDSTNGDSMATPDIVSALSRRLPNCSEPLFTVTRQDVLASIVRRLGAKALSLSTPELVLACEEVQGAIEHHLDVETYLSIGLDVWDITRNL